MKLERKIVMAMLTAVLLASLSFGGVILIASDQLEHSLLDTLVVGEADLFSAWAEAHPKRPLPTIDLTSTWLSPAQDAQIPAVFRDLPMGISHDIVWDKRYFHIIKRPLGEQVLTVAVDISIQEADEITLQRITYLGGIGIILLILALARAISHRVANPLQKLAAELNTLSPDAPQPKFFGRYQGAEAEIIAQALDRYVLRLGELVERERGFSSAASHELRSPLTVIRSSLELALMDEDLPAKIRPALTRANLNCVQLAQTLDGLMILARDAEPAPVAPIAASALLDEVCKELSNQRSACDVRRHDGAHLPQLRVPEAHWRILLNNLIRNALDHAPGKPVEIHLNAQELRVTDSGPGIPLDILPHVFERSRRSVQSRGAGLGLYIAAEITKRHGWTIHAENLPDGGCCVSVRFGTPAWQ